MLVLSRKVGEAIVIDGNIRLTVTSIRGRSVRVAVDAPKDVVILRDELLQIPHPALDATALGPRSALSPSHPSHPSRTPAANE
jgi:carbon storage regulator CsrA